MLTGVPLTLTVDIVRFPLKAPFVITGYVWDSSDTVRVTLEAEGLRGRGEAMGVYYQGETVETMQAALEAVRPEIEAGLSLEALQELLPSGGARCALDCAWWDLAAKRAGRSIYDLVSLPARPLVTVATITIESPAAMADMARAYAAYQHLKVKLSDDDPVPKLEAVRAARPDASLVIDVNQGWSLEALKDYAPWAARLGVAMIEQPLARGADAGLAGYRSPVPLGADESCLDLADYRAIGSLYDIINIKLDKCGGLTEGLKIVEAAGRDSKGLMVGNMTGSSLSMAPSHVIGQACRFVDIDGPLFLKADTEPGLVYEEGGIVPPPSPALWG